MRLVAQEITRAEIDKRVVVKGSVKKIKQLPCEETTLSKSLPAVHLAEELYPENINVENMTQENKRSK